MVEVIDEAEASQLTEFELLGKLEGGDIPQAVREQLTALLLPMSHPEQRGVSILKMIRHAFVGKDINELRYACDQLQRIVHGTSKTQVASLSDAQLGALLENATKTDEHVSVGTGTKGQRIYITKDELFMSSAEDEHSRPYQKNFRELFGLPVDTDPRVTF